MSNYKAARIVEVVEYLTGDLQSLSEKINALSLEGWEIEDPEPLEDAALGYKVVARLPVCLDCMERAKFADDMAGALSPPKKRRKKNEQSAD